MRHFVEKEGHNEKESGETLAQSNKGTKPKKCSNYFILTQKRTKRWKEEWKAHCSCSQKRKLAVNSVNSQWKNMIFAPKKRQWNADSRKHRVRSLLVTDQLFREVRGCHWIPRSNCPLCVHTDSRARRLKSAWKQQNHWIRNRRRRDSEGKARRRKEGSINTECKRTIRRRAEDSGTERERKKRIAEAGYEKVLERQTKQKHE